MWKPILAGAGALAIVGASLAYAQSGPAGFERAQRWRPSAQDVEAFGDAHIAALHAGLKLSAEQEKNWPALEAALRDFAKLRAERVALRANAGPPGDPIERLAKRAQAIEETGAALKKIADAAAPLYKSLDESQKHRFVALARFGMHRFGRWRPHPWRVRFDRPRFERGAPMLDRPTDHPFGNDQLQ